MNFRQVELQEVIQTKVNTLYFPLVSDEFLNSFRIIIKVQVSSKQQMEEVTVQQETAANWDETRETRETTGRFG